MWLKLPLYFCNKKFQLLLHQTEPMVQLYSNSVMNEFDWGSGKSIASLFLSSFGVILLVGNSEAHLPVGALMTVRLMLFCISPMNLMGLHQTF